MLDFIVFLAFFVVALFFGIGLSKYNEWGFGIAAAFLVLISIGLLGSGWETYSVSTYNMSYSGNRLSQISPQPFQITANATGTAEQQAIFGAGIIIGISSLACAFMAFQTRKRNKAILGNSSYMMQK